MQAKVKVQVVDVSLEEEYGKKANGLTDYDNKIQYYESKLRILVNSQQISGTVTVREKLEIGSIHEIYLSTDQSEQVVEMQGLAASRLKEE